jgi:hypothetical protein
VTSSPAEKRGLVEVEIRVGAGACTRGAACCLSAEETTATAYVLASLDENCPQAFKDAIEILLGKTGVRTNLLNKHNISLIDLSSKEQLVKKINMYKSYMVNLSNNSFIRSMSNTDLLNVRDEILGDLNQFLYLLTLE